jgi:hypothetical protein
MKKGFLCSLILLLIGFSSVFLCVYIVKGEDIAKSSKGSLIINGEYITSENVNIYYKPDYSYSELPLVAVLKGLGANVEWISNVTAYISYNDVFFELDLLKISFNEKGDSFNYITPTPGGQMICEVLEKELLLDSNTIKSIVYLIGINIFYNIDHAESIVYITEK